MKLRSSPKRSGGYQTILFYKFDLLFRVESPSFRLQDQIQRHPVSSGVIQSTRGTLLNPIGSIEPKRTFQPAINDESLRNDRCSSVSSKTSGSARADSFLYTRCRVLERHFVGSSFSPGQAGKPISPGERRNRAGVGNPHTRQARSCCDRQHGRARTKS